MKGKSTRNGYLIFCNSLSPEERFLLGIQLSEWAILLNKHIDKEIKERLSKCYCLV